MMFGQHKIPLKIEDEGISLTLEKEEDTLVYKRDCLGDELGKTLLTGKEEILIHPVEPLNTPKKLTPYLMIAFENPLVVEPKASKTIFVTFPVEIGVFLSGSKRYEPLDIISIAKKKFILYGSPRGGKICKYWSSDVYPSPPKVSYLHEGVLSLRIKNEADSWVTVTKAVFNGYGMKIHYNEKMVSSKAEMRIINKSSAETEFIASPLEKGMTKAVETYSLGRVSMTSTEFNMGEGI
ncbi:DUF432 domain-containing protein [Thermodesulfobacteriota bacterium]